jgi:hypothetical protein
VAKQVKPGRWLYGVAAGIFVVGTLVFLIVNVVGIRNNLKHEVAQRSTLERVLLPAIDEPVDFAKPGQHVVFIEHHPEDLPGEFEVVVDTADGEAVDLYEPASAWHYEREDELIGDAFAAFEVERPGEYVLNGGYMDKRDGKERFAAVGPWTSDRRSIGLTLVGFLGMFLSVVAGFVVGLVTWLKRRKALKAAGS